MEPIDNYTFMPNGTLTATGNTNGHELYYKPVTHMMQNGSSLSITLQFNNEDFLADDNAVFSICFHRDNVRVDGDEFLYRIFVYNWSGKFNIYDSHSQYTMHDAVYDLTGDTTTITFLYTINDGLMDCDYTINGTTKIELKPRVAVNTDLHWQPSFALLNTDTNIFTVTDVTFTAPVPEPATATLSLLALCGLATRRRRK